MIGKKFIKRIVSSIHDYLGFSSDVTKSAQETIGEHREEILEFCYRNRKPISKMIKNITKAVESAKVIIADSEALMENMAETFEEKTEETTESFVESLIPLTEDFEAFIETLDQDSGEVS